jgi:hypothetical protein
VLRHTADIVNDSAMRVAIADSARAAGDDGSAVTIGLPLSPSYITCG